MGENQTGAVVYFSCFKFNALELINPTCHESFQIRPIHILI
jgi:hypothetical protein